MIRSCVALLVVATSAVAQEGALTPFQEHKARSLLSTQLACLGCHELDGDGGRSAPSLTTVGSRRSVSYIRAIVADPQRVAPGAGMPKLEMPPATRDLVVRFLSRRASNGPLSTPAAPGPTPRTRSVAALYGFWCSSCHGALGRGDGPNAKYLPTPPAVHASAERMSARSDDALFDTIAGGGLIMGRSARMPAFGATLSRDEIRSLVGYIRTLCRCRGPAWSRNG